MEYLKWDQKKSSIKNTHDKTVQNGFGSGIFCKKRRRNTSTYTGRKQVTHDSQCFTLMKV